MSDRDVTGANQSVSRYLNGGTGWCFYHICADAFFSSNGRLLYRLCHEVSVNSGFGKMMLGKRVHLGTEFWIQFSRM